MSADLKYRRVLLKVSGEALMGERDYGLDPAMIGRIAGEIQSVHALGVELCLVLGGGNIFRGLSGAAVGMERASGDYMGMLATVINSLAMQNELERRGVTTRVQSAISMQSVCEPYIRRRALRHLEKGRVVIFGAGTGNPFFTTDTAAALRASEMGCDALLKATKVDGVYDADPHRVPTARRFDRLDYREVLARDLEVMDASAISLARENRIPILVFSIFTVPLNQVANVNVPEPRMITVQVWDRGVVKAVDKAIREAGLGLNPQTEGQVIRVPIPELNEERRRELTRVAAKYAEQARVSVRNVRRDGIEALRKLEKDGEISQDHQRKLQNDVQHLTDDHIKRIDETLAQKDKEILQV